MKLRRCPNGPVNALAFPISYMSKNNINDFIRCTYYVNLFFDRIDGIAIPWHKSLMITASQCRAARGLLDWSQQDLAERAGMGIVTVRHLEAGLNASRRATLDVARRAFEKEGVEFIEFAQPALS